MFTFYTLNQPTNTTKGKLTTFKIGLEDITPVMKKLANKLFYLGIARINTIKPPKPNAKRNK